MKAFRVTVLTACLLIGATSTPLPTADDSTSAGSRTIASKDEGACYLINGIWYCDDD